MSKGPGRIQRAVEAVFAGEPNDAFTTEDLCDRVYPGRNRIERKHRVAVIRAAKKVCERTGWGWYTTEALGGTLVFFNPYDVMSYAIGRVKADMLVHYRTNDNRIIRHWRKTAEDIRSMFEPGGDRHGWVVEGGSWWRHVQLRIAERDNDTSERAQRLRDEQEEARRHLDAIAASIRR